MKKLHFFCSCLNWDRSDIQGLRDMIDHAVAITRKTFLTHVDRTDRENLERQLCYGPHDPESPLTMARDPLVHYYRSTHKGRVVYYIRHSAIEHVFA